MGPRSSTTTGGRWRRWDPDDDPPELVDRELDRWWAATCQSLPGGVLHGDYYRRNLLCRQEHVVAVIDWHEACIGAIAAQVARAAWEMAHDEQLRFMADRARTFMHAYGPGAPSLQVALPLIRVSLRENIRHALTLAAHAIPSRIATSLCSYERLMTSGCSRHDAASQRAAARSHQGVAAVAPRDPQPGSMPGCRAS